MTYSNALVLGPTIVVVTSSLCLRSSDISPISIAVFYNSLDLDRDTGDRHNDIYSIIPWAAPQQTKFSSTSVHNKWTEEKALPAFFSERHKDGDNDDCMLRTL